MDKVKVDYILDVFKTLTNEMPDQMLYREDGDSFELRTFENMGTCMPAELQDSGWNLISSQMVMDFPLRAGTRHFTQ